MSRSKSVRVVAPSLLFAAFVIACSDPRPVAPDGEADPLQGRVQLQSPDTAVSGGSP